MAEKTAINICVDSELLTQAGALFNKFGMDTASAFELLLRRAIKDPTLLLSESVTPKTELLPAEIQEKCKAFADKIEHGFGEYGIDVKVIDWTFGPLLTLFRIQIPPVSSRRLSNVAKDVARDLDLKNIQVIECVPGGGGGRVDLEIPHSSEEIQPVAFNEIVSSKVFESSASRLTVALGKTAEGEPFVFDLAKAPHLLVGGESGSGKSVCLHTIIMSLLFKNNPPDLRLVLIDPKAVEFEIYEHNPYLLTPVITDMEKTYQALEWLVKEMERRFELMKAVGVRTIRDLNERLEHSSIMDPSSTEEAPRPLKKPPYIVVIIDEFADLILTNRRLTEILTMKLTQKARAAGIHLVIATQRPSVDILTPLVKTSCPTRIALKVATRYISNSIINESGAEELLGNGDMFFMSPGHPLQRVHGAIVDRKEIDALSMFLSTQLESKYIDLTVEDEEKVPESADKTDDDDAFYDKAVQIVVNERKASISYLQRKLGIEYERAARLVEKMEAGGIVSKPASNGRRRVLVDSTDIDESKN